MALQSFFHKINAETLITGDLMFIERKSLGERFESTVENRN